MSGRSVGPAPWLADTACQAGFIGSVGMRTGGDRRRGERVGPLRASAPPAVTRWRNRSSRCGALHFLKEFSHAASRTLAAISVCVADVWQMDNPWVGLRGVFTPTFSDGVKITREVHGYVSYLPHRPPSKAERRQAVLATSGRHPKYDAVQEPDGASGGDATSLPGSVPGSCFDDAPDDRARS